VRFKESFGCIAAATARNARCVLSSQAIPCRDPILMQLQFGRERVTHGFWVHRLVCGAMPGHSADQTFHLVRKKGDFP